MASIVDVVDVLPGCPLEILLGVQATFQRDSQSVSQ